MASAAVASPSPASVWRCLFCNNPNEERRGEGEESCEAIKALFSRDTYSKTEGGDLKSQLSVFFMLRSVLGLPTDFLGELLVEYGSPTSWKIQLCRACSRLYTEAEYLWNKIRALKKEFEKVSFEIKDLMVNSLSPEEGEALLAHSDDLEAHKAVIKEQLTSHKVPVVDTVRATFFLCLHEQSTESEKANNKLALKTNSKADQYKLNWHESGVPFLSFADFERKMKDLSESLSSLTKSATHAMVRERLVLKSLQSTVNSSSSFQKQKLQKGDEEDDDTDDITILDDNDTSQSSGKFSSNSANVDNAITSRAKVNRVPDPGPPPAFTEVEIPMEDDEPEEEPSIRIVQTSSLMEAEGSDEDDGTPQILEVVKHDPNDTEMGTETEDNGADPLGLSYDRNDPDYNPDDDVVLFDPLSTREAPQPPSNSNSTQNDEAVKHPEKYPSKLRELTVVPRRSGNDFECPKCSADFDTRSACQSHILKDHYRDRQPFHCHICSAKYDLLHQLNEHVAKFHKHVRTAYDDSFNPDTDYITFQKQDQASSVLDRQGGSSTENGSKKYFGPIFECPVSGCSARYEYKSKLNQHARSVHDINLLGLHSGRKKLSTEDQAQEDADNEALKCAVCSDKGILFKALTRDILDIHSKMRHGIRLPPERRMITVPKVAKKKVNPRLPARKKPSIMKCPDCELVLPTASAVVEHLKKPDNKCPECTKHFLFDMDLKRHLELDHADRRALQCPYCVKSFSAQTIYEKHIDNHQKFDMHECEVCHEKLTGFIAFTNHMETHHGCVQQQQLPDPDPEIFGF